MSIATKTGDSGQTSLAGGTRVSKADLRVEAYGTVDELTSVLGFARSICGNAEIFDSPLRVNVSTSQLPAKLPAPPSALSSRPSLGIGECRSTGAWRDPGFGFDPSPS